MATETSRIELLIDTVQTGKNMAEVTRAAKALNKELAGVGVDPATIAKGSAALAGLKDRLDQVKQTTAALDPDAKLSAYQKLGTGIVGTMGIATGALGLFGTKNEELNKVIERTNAVMAILGGVTAAQQALEAAGIIKNIGLRATETAGIGAQTVATVELTVAQRILNAVMSPMGLIVGVVGAIAAGYVLLSEKIKVTTEAQKDYNKVILDITQSRDAELRKNALKRLEEDINLFKESNKERLQTSEDLNRQLKQKEDAYREAKKAAERKDLEDKRKLLEEEQKYLSELEAKALRDYTNNASDENLEKYQQSKTKVLNVQKEINSINLRIGYKFEQDKGDIEADFAAQRALADAKYNNEKEARAKAAEDKRIALAKQKQEEFKTQYQKYLNDIKALEDISYQAEISSIEESYEKRKAVAFKTYQDSLKTINDTKVNESNKTEAIIAINKALETELASIEKDKADAQEKANLEAASNAAKTQNTIAENNKKAAENDKKLAQERIDSLKSYISYANQVVQQLMVINDILYTIEQQRLQANELRTKQYYDRLEYLENKRYSTSQNALNRKYQSEFNAAQGNATKQQQITDAYNEAVRQSTYEKEKAIAELEYQRQLREYANAEERNKIAEKEFKRNKAFQIASAAINTAAGVAGALSHSGDQTPALAIAQSIAIGIAGAAQIAKIASTKFSPTDIGQPPIAPIIEPNIPTTSTAGSEFNNGTPTPAQFNTEFITTGKLKGNEFVKVYVLESDITNVQNAVKAQVQNNTFG